MLAQVLHDPLVEGVRAGARLCAQVLLPLLLQRLDPRLQFRAPPLLRLEIGDRLVRGLALDRGRRGPRSLQGLHFLLLLRGGKVHEVLLGQPSRVGEVGGGLGSRGHGHRSPCLQLARDAGLLRDGAAGHDRRRQRAVEPGEVGVHGRHRDGHPALAVDLRVVALSERGDLLPHRGRLHVAAAEDRLHDDAPLARLRDVPVVVEPVLVVHVGRRVSDEEDDAQAGALAPRDAVDGIVEGTRDVLRRVAPAVGIEGREVLVDLVHVPAQVVDAGHVLVAEVAVAHERDAKVGPRPPLADAAGDRPDPPLGTVDETAHAAGGVEHEGHLHAWGPRLCHPCGCGRNGGHRERQGEKRHASPPAAFTCHAGALFPAKAVRAYRPRNHQGAGGQARQRFTHRHGSCSGSLESDHSIQFLGPEGPFSQRGGA